MNYTQSLQKWGNGSGVRIPKKVAEAAKIKLNQVLEITFSGNSIVLTPVVAKRDPTLEGLLEGVTPAAVGGEAAWGEDVGADQPLYSASACLQNGLVWQLYVR